MILGWETRSLGGEIWVVKRKLVKVAIADKNVVLDFNAIEKKRYIHILNVPE